MFTLRWTKEAHTTYESLRAEGKKGGRHAGLFKQLHKCLQYLTNDPRHPGLSTHKFQSLSHPYHAGQPVFEAYVQNRTPGAYRVFWCYGPNKNEITVIAITSHP